MSIPLRFDQLEPTRQAAIRKNLDVMKAKNAPDDDVESYLRDVEHLAPADHSSTLERAGAAIKQAVLHPIDALTGAAKAVGQSAFDTFAAPVVGQVPQSDLAMIHGTDKPVTAATPNAITPTRFKQAAAQTVANVATPSIAGAVTKGALRLAIPKVLATAAGTTAAGAAAGTVNSPEDPAAGAIAGGVLAPIAHGATKLATGGLTLAGRGAGAVGGRVMDIAGRPAESGAFVEGAGDRAARLNSPAMLEVAPADNVNKPLTPIELGGIQAARMARGLKTSSPAAEAVLSDALNQRADAAVGRVIDHAKELTGIKRGSGYETHEALKATTSAQGDEAYGKVWSAEGDTPVPSSPALDAVLERPAVKKALPVGAELRANLGEAAPSGRPSHIPPDQWGMLQSAAFKQGIHLPDEGSGFTLKDLHAAKLAMDDAFRSANERGSSAGRNQARGIASARAALLDVMDTHSPDYKAARSQFADNMSLEDASKQGMEHWTRDPDESAAMLKSMTPGEQQVYRDQAFNKWAQSVENGPADVSKNKPLRLARLRQLFPDDASFQSFKDGLKQEAQMHATNQSVFGGSNTADKLADLADMAGVTLPSVLKAMKGNPLPLLSKVGRHMLSERSKASVDALAAERAKLLVAGADGDAAARAAALAKMGITPLRVPAKP